MQSKIYRLTLYRSSHNRREWLHVEDHCRAIAAVLEHGKIGETYNVGSGVEKSIEEISNFILDVLNKPQQSENLCAGSTRARLPLSLGFKQDRP